MKQKPNEKLAYAIRELRDVGGPAPTKAYELVNSGELIAHKQGTRTIVLAENFKAYLRALPVVEPNTDGKGRGLR